MSWNANSEKTHKIYDLISFSGELGRLEFMLLCSPIALYLAFLYNLSVIDVNLGPAFLPIHIFFISICIILFFSNLVRRAIDAEFNDLAIGIFFLGPIIITFAPVVASILSSPFYIINASIPELIFWILSAIIYIMDTAIILFSTYFVAVLLFARRTYFFNKN